MKSRSTKVRALKGGKVLAGFAGSVADALTLFEKFEEKLDRYPGQPAARGGRAGQGLAERPGAAPARGAARRGRPRARLPAERLGRADRARRRHRRRRLGRQLRPRRRARAAADRRASAPARSCSARSRSPPTSASSPTGTSPFWSCRRDGDSERGRDPRSPPVRHAPHARPRHPSRRTPSRAPLPWLEEMPPRQIVAELDRYIVGPGGRQEGGRHRGAEPLAPRAGARRHPGRDHAEQHHHDRPHRRREDRDRAPARPAGRRAVHQGRGVEVHRGGLRRPRRRVAWCATWSTPRSTWCAPSARTRSIPRRSSGPTSGCSTCCSRRRRPRRRDRTEQGGEAGAEAPCSWSAPAARRRPRAAAAAEDERRQPLAREAARRCWSTGKLDDREVEIEVTPQSFPMMEMMQPPQGMEGRTSTSPRCCRRCCPSGRSGAR